MKMVEGETADQDIYLLNAAGTAFDLSSASGVTLIIKDREGTAVDTTGDASVPAPATQGIVRYSPDSTDFTAAKSPFYLHVKFTIAGKDFYIPKGPAHVITVSPPAAAY